MTKKIELTPPTHKRVETTITVQPRIDPAMLAAALGAEPTALKVETSLAPVTLFAVRQEMFKRLHSGAGLPTLTKDGSETKLPLVVDEWEQLEKIASALSSTGVTPTADQVAKLIFQLAVRAVASHIISPSGTNSAFARELATRAVSNEANP